MNNNQKIKLLGSICGIMALAGCEEPTTPTQEKMVYVVDAFAQSSRSSSNPINMIGLENIMTLEDVLHANHAVSHLSTNAHSPHTLKDRGITSLKTPSFTQEMHRAVYIDADGGNATHALQVYLDQQATFTGVYGHNINLDVRQGGSLNSGAFNLNHGELNIQNGGLVSINSMRIGKDARVAGGARLTYQKETPGVGNISELQQARAEKYGGWAKNGTIRLEGYIDELSLDTPMTLEPRGTTANVGVLKHQGGTLELSNTSLLTVESYKVSSPSMIRVLWKGNNGNTESACLTAKNIIELDAKNQLRLWLNELDASVKVNDKLKLISAKNGTIQRSSFVAIEGVGAQYQIEVDDKESTVSLKLSGRENNSHQLSGGTVVQALSYQIIEHGTGQAAQRLSVMTSEEAVRTLTPLYEGSYLSRPDLERGMLSLSETMLGCIDSGHVASGLGEGITSIARDDVSGRFGGVIVPLTSKTKVGVGVLNTIGRPRDAVGYSMAILRGNGFIEGQGDTQNGSLGYRIGYHMGSGVCFDVQGMHIQRSGAYESNLGYVRANQIDEFRGSVGLGVHHAYDLLQLSAQLRYEGFGYRQNYQMMIGDVEYTVDGHNVPNNWQFELQGTFKAHKNCNVSVLLGVGGDGNHHKAGVRFEWEG